MKYYLVEGTLLDAGKINDNLMEIHKAYTQRAMDAHHILLSGLKSNQSGAMFLMCFEQEKDLMSYLDQEPFYVHGIQSYQYHRIDIHYLNQDITTWL